MYECGQYGTLRVQWAVTNAGIAGTRCRRHSAVELRRTISRSRSHFFHLSVEFRRRRSSRSLRRQSLSVCRWRRCPL